MSIIELSHIDKTYRLYDRPTDRIREALHPRRKSYHKAFHALDDVSLTVEKGETLGIIGQNGSGKSTLLRMLTRVILLAEGRLTADGEPPENQTDPGLLGPEIGRPCRLPHERGTA